MKRDGIRLYKKHGRMDKYCKYMEELLQNEQAQYMELIEYYREANPDSQENNQCIVFIVANLSMCYTEGE